MSHLALLRGINVGGKNPVPMRELATVFTEAGCRHVRTYIQSGNVLFEAAPKILEKLSQQLTTAMEERFGFRIPVVLRSREEMNAVRTSNPFLVSGQPGINEDMLHVYFLSAAPLAERAALLDQARSLPDSFILQGREVYLAMPNGMGRTKLTNAYFDSKLQTISTARNWRTIQKLCELMGE